MNLIKQYIIQSISAASNNLRLSTEKIEVVALLRNQILDSENLEKDISEMKKITEFSRLAIRLNEIYNYLNNNKIDFFKFSDKFKEHSQYLIKDLSQMLDMVNPTTFRVALSKLNINETNEPPIQIIEEQPITLEQPKEVEKQNEVSESEKIKEKIIFEDEKDDEALFFQNFEAALLKPIKPLDEILKKLQNETIAPEELLKYAKIMKMNGDLSAKVGFDVIAGMHRICAKSLILVKAGEIKPEKEVIEAMRACLIVIVAAVRNKDVDITVYLNRAEEFSKKLQTIKLKDKNK